MKTELNFLEKIGFDTWFQDRLDPDCSDEFNIARVNSVHRDSYTLTNGEADVLAEVVGKLIYSADSPLDFPAVGDWVLIKSYNDNTLSIIHEVLPRKSLLKRKTSGKKIDFQLIAANIDVAFIVQSLDENFNLNRLDRYLIMIHDAHIQPIVLLSKSDLLSAEDIDKHVNDVHQAMPDLQVLPFSNLDASGLEDVKQLLKPGLTYCLLGSSGVGKTTLLNHLIGEERFKTQSVRTKDSKGRHATTSRQLILLDTGSMIIDTPGMRELGNFSTDTGLEAAFPEIAELSEHCRFSDCTHTREKGCAILQALEDGIISEKRYLNYMKINRESHYHDMSYQEKRRKDKQFGKMVKTVMKHKKNRFE